MLWRRFGASVARSECRASKSRAYPRRCTQLCAGAPPWPVSLCGSTYWLTSPRRQGHPLWRKFFSGSSSGLAAGWASRPPPAPFGPSATLVDRRRRQRHHRRAGDDGTDGRTARERLSGERLAAPEIIDREALWAWRRLFAAGRLRQDRVELAIADLEVLRLERVPHRRLLRRCWELRHNATVDDAAYVALAEGLGVTLLTADQRLASAPSARCRFELLR